MLQTVHLHYSYSTDNTKLKVQDFNKKALAYSVVKNGSDLTALNIQVLPSGKIML